MKNGTHKTPIKHIRISRCQHKKMSNSGCLFHMEKLGDVSRNVISKFTADEVYNGLLECGLTNLTPTSERA